jgi:cell division septation protein DedD
VTIRYKSRYFVFTLFLVCLPAPAGFASTIAEKAEELFLKEKYDGAMIEAQKAIDSDSGKKYEMYYLKGLSELKLKKCAESRKTFELILEKYPRSSRAFDSRIGIGDAYFLEGNTSGALRAYRAAAEDFGDDKNVVIARQRITDCLARPGAQETRSAASDISVPTAQIPSAARVEKVNFTAKNRPYIRQEKIVHKQWVAPAAASLPALDKGKYFCVQVGSFKNKSNAQKLASKLSAKRYEARVEPPAGSADKLYRVKVGKLSSSGEAERLAVKLKREGYPTRVCQED